MSKINGTARLWAVGAAFALASAAFGGITGNPLTITATSAEGTASFTLNVLDGSWSNNNTTWTYNGPTGQTIPLIDSSNNNTIAELEMGDLDIQFVFDPEVNLNFTAVAGASATTFTFSSALLSFPTLTGATATASAGITLQDRNGNGATFTGTQNGNTASYRADYNGLVPGGTQYAAALGLLTATPGGNNSASANFGPSPIASISDMSSRWGFTLSARDAATGTSSYVVVPAPGVAAMLGLAGLVSVSRRRR